MSQQFQFRAADELTKHPFDNIETEDVALGLELDDESVLDLFDCMPSINLGWGTVGESLSSHRRSPTEAPVFDLSCVQPMDHSVLLCYGSAEHPSATQTHQDSTTLEQWSEPCPPSPSQSSESTPTVPDHAIATLSEAVFAFEEFREKTPPSTVLPMSGKLSRPCKQCRISRVLCDRGLPCRRCTRLGCECVEPASVPRGRPSKKRLAERARLWGEQVPKQVRVG